MNQLFLTLAIDTKYKNKQLKPWLDTGFNGDLIINTKIAEQLRPEIAGRAIVKLADGKSSIAIVAYVDLIINVGEVTYNFQRTQVLIMENESDPVVGIDLLKRVQQKSGFRARLDLIRKKVEFIEN